MTDKQETGVFIIWEKGRYLSVPILRDISTEFEIKKVFEMYWPKQEFAVRLADFYGKNLPRGCHKEKKCGCGKFLIVVVRDKHPRYNDAGNNLNMLQAKYRYRDWFGGNNFIHGSDNKKEGAENIYKLLGISPEEFNLRYPQSWDGKIENYTAPARVSDNPAYSSGFWQWLNGLGRQLAKNLNLW